MIEVDPKWPGHVFNTTCLIGPEGVLYKYRKVIPLKLLPRSTPSPHDLPDYDEPLLPVADNQSDALAVRSVTTGCFPEAMRQLTANGAKVSISVSASGSVGRNRTDGVVDGGESLSRAGKHRLRCRGEPGREFETLSAVLMARRQPGALFSMDECSPKRHPGRASESSSLQSISLLCVMNVPYDAVITCWPTCALKRIRCTRNTSIRQSLMGKRRFEL